MRLGITAVIGIVACALAFAQVTRSPAEAGATAYFINLGDGDKVQSPVLVQVGLSGMGVAPAGAQFDNTGHFHVLIDVDESALDLNAPLPANENIIHFGKGQTETQLELPPGEHTLQLLMGDFSHIPHEPVVASERITVTVGE